MMLPLRSLMYPLVGCTVFATTLLGVCLWPSTSASAAGTPPATMPELSRDFHYKQTKSYV